MATSSASAVFSACLEIVLAQQSSERARNVLQRMAASIQPAKLDLLQAGLDRKADASPRRAPVELSRIPEQLAAMVPQICALDLDRCAARRILGVGPNMGPVLLGAKGFGHDVLMSCRISVQSRWALRLYDLPHFEPTASQPFPPRLFDVIIATGTSALATKQAWAQFLLPLADRIAENGCVFVALPAQADRRARYYPRIVLDQMARIGARVSSRHHFVLIDKSTLGKLTSGPRAETAQAAPSTDPDPAPEASVVSHAANDPAPQAPLPVWKAAVVHVYTLAFAFLLGRGSAGT